MKQSNNQLSTWTLWSRVLLMLFMFASTIIAEAKVTVRNPPSNKTPGSKMSTRYGNSNSNSSDRANKRRAIYAEGHKVLIKDAGNGDTYIWIDENDNNRVDTDETLTTSLSNVYIYGGSEDANVTANVNIDMQGGTVAGIFGGGYAGDKDAKVTGNVNIYISNGTVGLVDGGGDDYDDKYKATISGNVDIFLKNPVKYTGKYYINDNYSGHIYGVTSVFDFSEHTYDPATVQWGTAGARNYICQIGPNQWSILMRTKKYVIPQGCVIEADQLKVDMTDAGYITNYGYVSVNPCGGNGTYINPYISGRWTGNAIKRDHTPAGSVLGKSEAGHKRKCSTCKEEVTEAHTFIYKESSDSNIDNACHSMICSACGYTTTERCTRGYQMQNDVNHAVICTSCKHTFSLSTHACKPDFDILQFNSLYHIAECRFCDAQYKTSHDWSCAESPTCSACNSTNHIHKYEDGACLTCGYNHVNHDYKVDENTDVSICKVCGLGCTHTRVYQGVVYDINSIGTFPNEKSMTSAGHYLQCPICDQYIYWDAHNMVFNATSGAYECDRWECEYSCNHVDHLKHRTSYSYRSELTPSFYNSYRVEHDEVSCTKCGNLLPCYVSDSEGTVLGYMTNLDQAFTYIIYNRLDNAKITLTNSQTYDKPLSYDLRDKNVTLDMNDCDLSFMGILAGNSALSISHGNLFIINSKYAETHNYAQIYANNSDATLKARYEATISIDGVSVYRLDLGKNAIHVGHAASDFVKLYRDEDNYVTITDTLLVSRWITGWNGYANRLNLSTALPVGYVIAEKMVADSATYWNTLYDHSTTDFWATGGGYGTGWVAILPCGNHELTQGTSQGTEGHSGLCAHCRTAVTGYAHEMTQPGTEIDNRYHHLSCAICGYESDDVFEAHTFNSSTGRCTNSQCNAEASIALNLEGSSSTLYFATIEAAWEQTNRVGSIDTLTLLKNVSFSQPLEMAMSQEEGNTYGVPSILIQSATKGLSLTYTGTGCPVSVNEAVANQPQIYLCKDLSVSSNFALSENNQNFSSLPIRPMYGSVFNASKDTIIACPSHDNEWSPEYKNDTIVLPYHEATCKICGEKSDENHCYRDSQGNYHTTCQKCNINLVPVAKTYASDGTQLGEYGSLKDAWYDAIAKSANRNGEEIKVEAINDAVVERWNTYEDNYGNNLDLINANAKILLAGGDYMIKSFDGYLINVIHGQLTIESGTYQGQYHAVYRYNNADAVVQLKGGTYLSGYSWRDNTDGICEYYTNWSNRWTSEGIGKLIAPGHILTVSEKNSGSYYTYVDAGDIVTIETSSEIASASGTVTACSHDNLSETIAAKAADCTHNGNIEYRFCPVCRTYFHQDANENTIASNRAAITTSALQHNYDAEGVCQNTLKDSQGGDSICGNKKCTVSLTVDGTTTPYDNFTDAWNNAVSKSESNKKATIILYADITISEDDCYDLTMSIETDYNIEIDLNGHNLDIRNNYLSCNYWYEFEMKLKFTDSQKSGNVYIGSIDFGMPYPNTYIIVEDVALHVLENYNYVDYTEIKGNGGIIFHANENVSNEVAFVDIKMEVGTYIESQGLPIFYIFKGSDGTYDSHDAIANAFHNATYYSVDAQTHEATQLTGTTHPSFNSAELNYESCLKCTVIAPNGEEAGTGYKWRITEPKSSTVSHTRVENPTDNGDSHGAPCITCGFTPHDAHNYSTRYCSECGHEAEVEVITDGISTFYTVADSAFAALPDTAYIKLNKNCILSSNWEIDSANKNYTLNLNDHTLKADDYSGVFDFNLTHGRLTIQDGTEGKGKISTTYYYQFSVENNPDVQLTLLGGSINNCTIDASDSINTESTAKILIEQFGFDYLYMNGSETTALELMGENCFMQDGNGNFITEGTNQEFYDIRIFKGQNLLATTDSVRVQTTDSLSDSDKSTFVESSLKSITTRSFEETGILDVVALTDGDLINSLQSQIFKAGSSEIISTDKSAIKAYVEAVLSEMTIEESQVDETTVRAVTCMTFDVTPYLSVRVEDKEVRTEISNSQLLGNIRFRLPVDSNITEHYLEVFHTNSDGVRSKYGNFEVEMDSITNEKYIEIIAREFSVFDYQTIQEYILSDAQRFANKKISSLKSVKYERSFAAADKWEPLYIPMSIRPTDDCDIADIYTFGAMADTNGDGIIDANDETVLIVEKLEATDQTDANTPYLIRTSNNQQDTITFESVDNTLYTSQNYIGSCSSTRTKYTFRSVYSPKDFATGESALTLEEGTIGTPSQSLVPQRWFVEVSSKTGGYNQEIAQAESSRIRVFTIGEDMDEETALRILKGESVDVWQNGKCYTLDGRCAVRPAKGINIVNGKKVMANE